MLNLKKKLKKFLPFLLSCIILVSSFTFVSSASQTSDNTFVMSCGKPYVNDFSGYIEILLQDVSSGDYYVRTFCWNVFDFGSSLGTEENDFDLNTLQVFFNVSQNDSGRYVIKANVSAISGIRSTLKGNIYSLLSSGTNWSGSYQTGYFVYDYEGNQNYSYDTSLKFVSYHVYGNCRVIDNYDIFVDKEFYVLYAEDGAIYNAITSGQQDQTNQIIQSQQEQTDKIKENQDKNTDKLINGGHDSPQYNGADETAVDNYKQAEKSVMDKISGGLDDAADLFSGFTGIISPGAFTGLSVVSTYMEKFMRIPHIALLVRVALTLGLFSFIIGSAMIMVRWGGSNNRRFDSGLRRTGRSKGF